MKRKTTITLSEEEKAILFEALEMYHKSASGWGFRMQRANMMMDTLKGESTVVMFLTNEDE